MDCKLNELIVMERDAKPILKWAGGKTQLLKNLEDKFPKSYNKYIEPFFGGGAVFFHLNPDRAVIADLNDELVNLYRTVASDVEAVIDTLKEYENNADFFYAVRSQDRSTLNNIEASARTIYLNRTCFNGLYRVNKQGGFNVPYGRYVNPKICNEDVLRAASAVLRRATILLGDYKDVLLEHAEENDLIFLDPPYLPISEYSDFKRYTKEQFHESDHEQLRDVIRILQSRGCHTILTNSNHPIIHEQFKDCDREVVNTKRNINSNATKRTGEDLIVTIPAGKAI
jgi:DNA adenine methylase